MDARVDLHLLIARPDGPEFLATADDRLPSAMLTLPPNRPAIAGVVDHLRRAFGLGTPVLETFLRWDAVEEPEPLPLLVSVEPPPATWRPPDGLAWRPLVAGPRELPAPLQARADELVRELRTGAPPPALRPRWARAGWYERAVTWAAARLDAAGRLPTGPFAQTYLRGISALLRVPTAAGDAYLKAVFPIFHHEPVVSVLLEERIPGATPHVIAIEPDEGWLLMDDVGGRIVREGSDAAALRLGIGTLVGLQRRLAVDVGAFVESGCPIRPLDRLAADLAGAFGEPAAPSGRSPERIERIVGHVAAAAERVAGLGIHESIVHGDFHAGNVVVADGRATIFDWSDAALGSPVVDLVTWLLELDSEAARNAAITAWIDAWSDVVEPADVRKRLDDILAVGAAYQVVSYVGIIRALEPATRFTMSDAFATFLNQLDEAVPGRDAPGGQRRR